MIALKNKNKQQQLEMCADAEVLEDLMSYWHHFAPINIVDMQELLDSVFDIFGSLPLAIQTKEQALPIILEKYQAMYKDIEDGDNEIMKWHFKHKERAVQDCWCCYDRKWTSRSGWKQLANILDELYTEMLDEAIAINNSFLCA